jgi:hypothetical protein
VTAVLGISGIIATFLMTRWYYKLEEMSKLRDEARANLKAHYKNIVQRMEQWNYSCDMIYVTPGVPLTGFGLTPIAPPNLEKDLKHLNEFKRTWELYSRGPEISSDFKTKQGEALDLVKHYLKSMIEAKGVAFPNWKMDDLLKTFTEELLTQVRMDLNRQTFEPNKVTPPRDFESSPGLMAIGSYSFQSNKTTAETFVGILDTIRRLYDVKEQVKAMDDAFGKMNEHVRSFTSSLKDDVIETVKNGDYTDERLFSGVCEDCKHLKELAGLAV